VLSAGPGAQGMNTKCMKKRWTRHDSSGRFHSAALFDKAAPSAHIHLPSGELDGRDELKPPGIEVRWCVHWRSVCELSISSLSGRRRSNEPTGIRLSSCTIDIISMASRSQANMKERPRPKTAHSRLLYQLLKPPFSCSCQLS